ncbi:Trypanosomal VSG domain containing protein [Trypanosoma brucei equiperdum]|uniref:Trypanosomal VSG domain containing protein n=1 Tax=Trypanosoma brucei equiperdum TaxID=630700 RepID=A0A3L6L1V8_9TRYP|nr:Trypanosomal VSG domain containing protein [Trypanosoma brucei equiperdum]
MVKEQEIQTTQFSRQKTSLGHGRGGALTFILIVATAQQAVFQVDAAAANLEEFRILCRLISLAHLTPPENSKNVVDDSVAAEIDVLNMSASTDGWKNSFLTTTKTPTANPPECSKPPKHAACDPNYSQHKAAHKLAESLKDPQKKRTYAISPAVAESAAGRRVQKLLDRLAKQAREQASNTNSETRPEAKLRTVTHKLNQALYGTQEAPAAGTYAIQWRNTNNRQTDCTAPNAGLTLLSDLGCICVKDNTQNAGVCGNGVVSGNTGWSTDAAAAKLTELAGKCTTLKPTDLTPANIRSAVAAALAKIKQKGGNDFKLAMGKQTSTSTCGASAAAGCVEYAAAVASGKPVHIEPKWATHMLAAANALEQLEEARKTAEQTRAHLEDLKERAKALHTTLLIVDDPISPQPQQAENANPVSKRQICKPQNKSTAECPSEH